MGRLACEFCGTKIGVRACYSCGTIVCSDCAGEVSAKKVLCKECASNPVAEEEAEEVEAE
ncbi:MAG: hypothetical protein WED04_07015 [Promethearchaeati archaeon SRVP18_Atabeyarchaeia-1]